MLLIPIGQDDNVVRRTPWVSVLLIVLNVLAFVGMAVLDDGSSVAVLRLTAFVQYLQDHPYLTLDEELARRLGEGFQETHARAYTELWRRGVALDEQQLIAEQQQLDELAAAARAAWRAMPLQRLGYVPAEPSAWRALSSMFVHAGWLHLIGNMLFLFLSGPFVEDRYGRLLFGLLYGFSGLAALGAHAVHAPGSLVPLVGASGAIAGVMGAFLVRLARTRIHFLVLPIPILWMLRFKVRWPAYVVLPLWFAEQYFYAQTSPDSGVAFWAHVGGFAFGALSALAIKFTRLEERVIHGAIEKRISLAQDPALEAALEARLAGDFATASGELRGLLAREPDNVDGWSEAYELALASGDDEGVSRAFVRLLGLYQRLGEGGLLAALLDDRRWRDAPRLPASAWLVAAAQLERSGDARAALEFYEQAVTRAPQEPSALRALVRRGVLLGRAGDVVGSQLAYEQARRHPACDDTWSALVERALGELARSNRRPTAG